MAEERRALVVGLGIGGMSAAIGLRRAGWTVVIVERAPARRTGGYFVGLFPQGKEAANHLGVFDYIHLRTAANSKTWDVRDDGSRQHSIGFLDQPGVPEGVLRGDIEAGLWKGIDGVMDVRFGTVPSMICEEGDRVRVRLVQQDTGATKDEVFNLVIGADGVRSTVRRLVFGPHDRFLKPMGAIICAYQLGDQVASFKDRDGIMLCEVNRGFWVFPLADHAPTALFTYRTRDVDAQFKRRPIDILREVYSGLSGEGIVEHALDELERSDDYLFDSVQQVRMRKWHKGRVVLLGDAAWCLTLYSGMGAASAMKGGAELSDALAAHPEDVGRALMAWESALRPLIRKFQFGAYIKSEFFVPSTPLRSVARRLLMHLGARRLVEQRKRLRAPADAIASQEAA